MKRIVVSIIILLAYVSINAQNKVDSLFTTANEHYIEGRFDKAAELYQMLVDSGFNNAELYFNLGNAYFKLNRIPYAIVNYERANMLNPGDEDIQFNLEYTRTFTIDRIEPLPVFFLTQWYRNIRAVLTSNGWAIASLVFLGFTMLLLLFFWFSFSPWLKRISFAFAILALSLGVLSSVFSYQEKTRTALRNQAIIFKPVVTVKSSPGDTGKDIFILHSGTKVQITKAIGQWVEIRIADGNKGWILAESLELI
jgi:tetratricopeptide (TPR) repeat protein